MAIDFPQPDPTTAFSTIGQLYLGPCLQRHRRAWGGPSSCSRSCKLPQVLAALRSGWSGRIRRISFLARAGDRLSVCCVRFVRRDSKSCAGRRLHHARHAGHRNCLEQVKKFGRHAGSDRKERLTTRKSDLRRKSGGFAPAWGPRRADPEKPSPKSWPEGNRFAGSGASKKTPKGLQQRCTNPRPRWIFERELMEWRERCPKTRFTWRAPRFRHSLGEESLAARAKELRSAAIGPAANIFCCIIRVSRMRSIR